MPIYESPNKNVYEHVYRDFFIDFSHKSGTASWHSHNTGEFLFAQAGKTISTISDQIYRLEGPYIIYYPPYIAHTQLNDPAFPYRRFCMSVDPEYIDGSASDLPQSYFAINLTPDEYERLHGYVSLLYKHYSGANKDPSENALTRRKYLLLLFLNELSPIITKHNPELLRSRYRYINEVCSYISSHIGEKLSLSELSDRFFISRTKLIQDFRAAKNTSVGDYITAVRISKSKLLLRDGLQVCDIARECGFSSSAYFIRVFEKLNRVTPSRFKRSLDEYISFDNDTYFD